MLICRCEGAALPHQAGETRCSKCGSVLARDITGLLTICGLDDDFPITWRPEYLGIPREPVLAAPPEPGATYADLMRSETPLNWKRMLNDVCFTREELAESYERGTLIEDIIRKTKAVTSEERR